MFTQLSPELLLDDSFQSVKRVATDSRGRLTVGSDAGEQNYRVYKNSSGQILLDPIVEMSQSELRAQKAKIAELKNAIEEAKSGDLHDLGSFSNYVG